MKRIFCILSIVALSFVVIPAMAANYTCPTDDPATVHWRTYGLNPSGDTKSQYAVDMIQAPVGSEIRFPNIKEKTVGTVLDAGADSSSRKYVCVKVLVKDEYQWVTIITDGPIVPAVTRGSAADSGLVLGQVGASGYFYVGFSDAGCIGYPTMPASNNPAPKVYQMGLRELIMSENRWPRQSLNPMVFMTDCRHHK